MSQNRTEKQIMPSKTKVNCLFNDIWCYLFIFCFDWKIDVFQQTVGRVYYVLKCNQKRLRIHFILKIKGKTHWVFHHLTLNRRSTYVALVHLSVVVKFCFNRFVVDLEKCGLFSDFKYSFRSFWYCRSSDSCIWYNC